MDESQKKAQHIQRKANQQSRDRFESETEHFHALKIYVKKVNIFIQNTIKFY